MIYTPTVKLNSSYEMPLVGLGTWKLDKAVAAETIYYAIKLGYRLIDYYGNEVEVGQGVRRAIEEGIVERSDLFIVTKLWNSFHDFKRVEESCRMQLQDWGLEYFDLFIVHFPLSQNYVDPHIRYPPNFFDADGVSIVDGNATIQETWTAMEQLVHRGLVRSIGISNFQAQLIMDLLRYARIKPATLQVEHHPYLVQRGLIQYAQSHNIQVTAYSSFATGSYLEMGVKSAIDTPLLFDHPTIQKIAKAHGKTSAQVLLRWSTQRKIAVIPKATDPKLLKENLDSFGFELTASEIEEITSLDQRLRFNDPLNYGIPVPVFS